MEQLRTEWTVINSKLVKHATALVNKRIEKAYIKLPSKTLLSQRNEDEFIPLTEGELVFDKIQHGEIIEYGKLQKALLQLKECHEKINDYGKKKIEELHKCNDTNDKIGIPINNNKNYNNRLAYMYNINHINKIMSAYSQEMKVKERIIEDINGQRKREILLAYTATILMEPYLTQI
jgi:hypothetical protein